MPWRIRNLNVAVFEIETPQMVVDIEHNKNRKVFVTYYNRSDEQVDIAVEHIDDNNLRVSAVNFLDGYLLII